MRLTTATLQTMVNAKPAWEVNSGSTGYGAMHNPLRLGTVGKNNIPTPVWRFENEGGWGAGFQKSADRLSKTERKG